MSATAASRSTVDAGAAASELVKALNNSARRSILRTLLDADAPLSSKQIRKKVPAACLSGSQNQLNFHLRFLVEFGVVKREEKRLGYREGFYSPMDAIRAPWCVEVLKLTEAEDSGRSSLAGSVATATMMGGRSAYG